MVLAIQCDDGSIAGPMLAVFGGGIRETWDRAGSFRRKTVNTVLAFEKTPHFRPSEGVLTLNLA